MIEFAVYKQYYSVLLIHLNLPESILATIVDVDVLIFNEPNSQARWVTLAWTWKGASPESGVLIQELNGERSFWRGTKWNSNSIIATISIVYFILFPLKHGMYWSMLLLVHLQPISSYGIYVSSGWASCWLEVLQRAVLLAAAGPAAHSAWA